MTTRRDRYARERDFDRNADRVEASDRDDYESFVTIGTVQPLDVRDVKAKDRNAFLPVHLQEARDEKGRKRLHGAFTGGFSAGYFNTVGSKEGWQPQHFVSTRNKRSKYEQKAEDFMDEEDIAELEESQKVTAKDDFDILGGTEKELAKKRALVQAATINDQSAVVDLAGDILIPSKDPVGIRLLRRMGWREGQGVGPRVKRKRDLKEEGEEDIYAQDQVFAPRDITAIILTGRKGVHGLGYNPYETAPELKRSLKEAADHANDSFNIGIKGGFGTGILDEDDDDDFYSVASKPSQRYGLVIEEDEDDSFSSTPAQDKPKQLTADQRREMLGEEELTGPTRSVFSFINPKDQDRLQQLIERATSKGKLEAVVADIDQVDKASAEAALKGYIPFGNDSAKQERYKRFLEIKAGLVQGEILHPPHFTQTEIMHETREFVKSAQMYRPLTGLMASRFTSSASTIEPAEDDKKPQEPPKVEYGFKTRTKTEWRPVKLLCKRFNVRDPYADDKKKDLSEDVQGKEILNEKAMAELRNLVLVDPLKTLNEKGGAAKEEGGKLIPDSTIVEEEKPKVVERPPMDVFKAIFATSDEESSDDEVKSNQKRKTGGIPELHPVDEPAKIPYTEPKIPELTPVEPTIATILSQAGPESAETKDRDADRIKREAASWATSVIQPKKPTREEESRPEEDSSSDHKKRKKHSNKHKKGKKRKDSKKKKEKEWKKSRKRRYSSSSSSDGESESEKKKRGKVGDAPVEGLRVEKPVEPRSTQVFGERPRARASDFF
ncbi:hypothetical protein HDV05_001369 [Chytridiales sp. JEL 0842]|nr:hypothetical protein HDV05_001369 [Chytridiales sp. JEL 0842]